MAVTPLAVARRIDQLKLQLAQLIALRGRDLTADEAMWARWIDYRIRAELLDLEVIEAWKHDPIKYFRPTFTSIAYLLELAPGSPSDRVRSVQNHLHELDGMMANMRGNLDRVPDAALDRSMEVGARLERALESEIPEWGNPAAGVDVRLRESFQLALERATQSVDLGIGWLENAPRDDDTELALGEENFVMSLLFNEGIAIPLAELRETAVRSLDEDQAAFLDAARAIDPSRTPRQLLDSNGGAVSPEETATEFRRYLDQVRRFAIDHGLVPEAEYGTIEVQEAPEYQRQPLTGVWLEPMVATAVSLGQETLSTTTETALLHARLYFSPPAAGWPEELILERNAELQGPALMLSAASEALPGRYLMDFYVTKLPTATRRLLRSRGAEDGWAAYAEELLVEQGFGGDDPRVRLVYLWRNLIADCRLVAAVRLHTEGASLEGATDLFVNRAYLPRELARLEARRALLDPSATVGSLAKRQILDLREQYRQRQGDSFRLEEFHAAYLALGPVPVSFASQRLLASD